MGQSSGGNQSGSGQTGGGGGQGGSTGAGWPSKVPDRPSGPGRDNAAPKRPKK
jgi:hypothetical protein